MEMVNFIKKLISGHSLYHIRNVDAFFQHAKRHFPEITYEQFDKIIIDILKEESNYDYHINILQ